MILTAIYHAPAVFVCENTLKAAVFSMHLEIAFAVNLN